MSIRLKHDDNNTNILISIYLMLIFEGIIDLVISKMNEML